MTWNVVLLLFLMSAFPCRAFAQNKDSANTGLLIVAGSPDSDRHIIAIKNTVTNFLRTASNPRIAIVIPKYVTASTGNRLLQDRSVNELRSALIRSGLNLSDPTIQLIEVNGKIYRSENISGCSGSRCRISVISPSDPLLLGIKVASQFLTSGSGGKRHIEVFSTGHGPRWNELAYYLEETKDNVSFITGCSTEKLNDKWKPVPRADADHPATKTCISKDPGNDGSGIGWEYPLSASGREGQVHFTQTYGELLEFVQVFGGAQVQSIQAFSLTCFSRVAIAPLTLSGLNSCGLSSTHPINAHMSPGGTEVRMNWMRVFEDPFGTILVSDAGFREIQHLSGLNTGDKDGRIRASNKPLGKSIAFSQMPMNLLRMLQIGNTHDRSNFAQWSTSSYAYLRQNYGLIQPSSAARIRDIPGNPYNPDQADPKGKKTMCLVKDPQANKGKIKKAFVELLRSLQVVPNARALGQTFDSNFFWDRDSSITSNCLIKLGGAKQCPPNARPHIELVDLQFPHVSPSVSSFLNSVEDEVRTLLINRASSNLFLRNVSGSYSVSRPGTSEDFDAMYGEMFFEPLWIYNTYRYLYFVSLGLHNASTRPRLLQLLTCEAQPMYAFD